MSERGLVTRVRHQARASEYRRWVEACSNVKYNRRKECGIVARRVTRWEGGRVVGVRRNVVQQLPCSDLGDARTTRNSRPGWGLPHARVQHPAEWSSVNVHHSPPTNLVVDNLLTFDIAPASTQ